MLKALLKKQLLELKAFFLFDKKTGKPRSKGGTIGFIILFAFLFTMLAVSFFGVSFMFSVVLTDPEIAWVYFAIVGAMSMFLGVFGSVFNTFTSLYQAKDNEMLLAMPIPSRMILAVRMAGVFLLSMLYTCLVYVPALIAYFIFGSPSALGVINAVLLLFVLGIFILSVTCLLGWVVALISGKLKNKSFITVIISLVLLGGYYYLCFNYTGMIEGLLNNIGQVSETIRRSFSPLYAFGRAATGDALCMVIVVLAVAALFALTVLFLTKTFRKITTQKNGPAKKVYKETEIKTSGLGKALFKKEMRRFTSSAAYMLNCALGTVMMPLAGVALLIGSSKVGGFHELFVNELGLDPALPAMIVLGAVLLVASLNDITAPSISLEGKNIWVLQTMPIPAKKILEAKMRVHWVVTAPSLIILSICASIAFGLDAATAAMITLDGFAFMLLIASLGLAINLKRPDLSWTNEAVPIKQSIGVMVCLFGGWAIALTLGGLGLLAAFIMEPFMYLVIVMVVLILATRLLNRWLGTRGAEIFEKL